jgi:DNA segregation ATPase FtsK/SpoIIIE, S-DNA-T family
MIKNHYYRDMKPDELENVFSNFLFDSFSYTKVDAFARNEKAFEMAYIYGIPFRQSSSMVAGKAYHKALEYYFNEKMKGITKDITELQQEAYALIDEVAPLKWKLQKTTPSIEECKQKANDSVNALLKNFFSDIQIYESEIKSVLYVELYIDEFLTINGVDIPLPCHGVIDLVFKTNDDKIVILDHKSKTAYTDEKDVKFSIGKQAITYVNLIEAKTDLTINEVWFVENKITQNKDKSPQLVCNKVEVDKDTRRLYEALLYEPLKRMLEAISNPDYVYLINESDNFVDKAEIYEFWAKTLIAEVSDFNIKENKKELIGKRLKKIRDASLASIDPKTIKKFRENASQFIQFDLTNKDMTRPEKIIHTLRNLNLVTSIEHVFSGFSSETYLLELSAGTNISSIFRYKLDIANALGVENVRINKDLYVYQGKSYIAVEAKKTREKDLIFDPGQLEGDKIPLGFDNFNQKIVWDISNSSTPHMLVGGSTGSGKSVLLISIIEYAKLMKFDDIYILDPKYEFTRYNGGNISVYSDIEEIETVMESLVEDMNVLVKTGKVKRTLVVFDEFADSISQSRSGNALNVYKDEIIGKYANGKPKTKRVIAETKKCLEENLRLLLQKGRSSGFRIIAATQRASVKIMSGDLKVNFGTIVCFSVPKEIDSKVILDEAGAESLSGKGDGLLKSPQYKGTIRFQAFYKK